MISLKKISTGSNSSNQSMSVGEAVSMETSSDSNNNKSGCNSIENEAGERRKSDTAAAAGGDGRSVINFKMNTGCAGDLFGSMWLLSNFVASRHPFLAEVDNAFLPQKLMVTSSTSEGLLNYFHNAACLVEVECAATGCPEVPRNFDTHLISGMG